MNTCAMYLFQFFLFLINLRSCDNSVFALSIWFMKCRLVWKKSNLKQFNIRQQHNKMGYEYFLKALYMKHHYFKRVIFEACPRRNTENIAINCSNTSPFTFWTQLMFITVILRVDSFKVM